MRPPSHAGVLRLAVVAVVLLSAVADAEPDPERLYGRAGVGFGSVMDSTDNSFGGREYGFAAGVRFADHAWFRGALSVLEMGQDTYGHLVEPRAGIELRQHDTPYRAGFIGIDAGWLSGHSTSEAGDESITGAFVMPRGGWEVGWEHVRFQLVVEVVVGYGRSVAGNVQPETTGRLFGGTFELGLIVR